MRKTAIVYWSGTGNTEAMAQTVEQGVKNAGGSAELFEAGAFRGELVDQYDSIAFGCPSMGVEQLEESEFEPMFTGCESKLAGKTIALFGSYGWGDGEWMRTWEDACRRDGAVLACESVICMEAPDDEALERCRNLGAALT